MYDLPLQSAPEDTQKIKNNRVFSAIHNGVYEIFTFHLEPRRKKE